MNNMREFVLRKPRMFIGHEWDAEGLYFLLARIMEQAISPEMANDCSQLEITIEDQKTVSIRDDGRGLPVEYIRIWESDQRPKIEHVFTWIITRHPLPDYYVDFGYLDYLGYLLNIVSERLRVETIWQRTAYELLCGRGEIISGLRRLKPATIDRGTHLRFTPDAEVFRDFTFDAANFAPHLNQLRSEFPSISITLKDHSYGR